MRKLVKSGVAPFRVSEWRKQEGICLLCKQTLEKEDAVLDHCHKTGECRGILHRGCNALLGKIENARPQNGLVDDAKFQAFLSNVASYILSSRCGILHPSHKTADEKKAARNKKARLTRKRTKTMIIGD